MNECTSKAPPFLKTVGVSAPSGGPGSPASVSAICFFQPQREELCPPFLPHPPASCPSPVDCTRSESRATAYSLMPPSPASSPALPPTTTILPHFSFSVFRQQQSRLIGAPGGKGGTWPARMVWTCASSPPAIKPLHKYSDTSGFSCPPPCSQQVTCQRHSQFFLPFYSFFFFSFFSSPSKCSRCDKLNFHGPISFSPIAEP